MEKKVIDRRIRKTKNALKEGLIELMLEKSINDISVKELTERVDLNRGTFYLHYKDIFDLLEKLEEEILQEFTKILDSYPLDVIYEHPLPLLEEVFLFLKNNSSMFTVLLSNNGDIYFINKIKSIIKNKCFTTWGLIFNNKESYIFDYFYSYTLSGFIGLFSCWLNNGLKESPEEMALLAEKFILNGLDVLK